MRRKRLAGFLKAKLCCKPLLSSKSFDEWLKYKTMARQKEFPSSCYKNLDRSSLSITFPLYKTNLQNKLQTCDSSCLACLGHSNVSWTPYEICTHKVVTLSSSSKLMRGRWFSPPKAVALSLAPCKIQLTVFLDVDWPRSIGTANLHLSRSSLLLGHF